MTRASKYGFQAVYTRYGEAIHLRKMDANGRQGELRTLCGAKRRTVGPDLAIVIDGPNAGFQHPWRCARCSAKAVKLIRDTIASGSREKEAT